jgi:hypothetical protein
MKAILLALAVSVSLTGCGWFDRHVVANITGYSTICVEGINYLQFPSGVTPKLNKQTKQPQEC